MFLIEIIEPTWAVLSTRTKLSLTDLPNNKTPTPAYQEKFKEVVENKYKGWKHIYRRFHMRNSSGSGSYHWELHRIWFTTKIKLYIHIRCSWNTPNSEYNICNKRKWRIYIQWGETSIWIPVKINLRLFLGRKTMHKSHNLFIMNCWT